MSARTMHRLLRRQLEKHTGGIEAFPPELSGFLEAVNEAYEQSDIDRRMLERSMELSSRELLQANSEMRGVFQAIPDLFLRVDAGGLVLDQRGGSYASLFPSTEPVRGKRLSDIGDPDVAEQLLATLRRAIQSREMATLEYSLLLDGGEQWFEARMSPLYNNEVVVIVRDISDRKDAERALARHSLELARSNAELAQFANIASHDLQEPLRTIDTYLQLLAQKHGNALGGEAAEFVRHAIDGAQRMRSLIDDLLSYARVTSQAKPLAPANVRELVDRVTEGLAVAIEESGAQIACGELPVVWCDRSQLAQVLQNLLSNAIKFRADRAPRIEIGAQQRDAEWHFTIADNGIGMDPKHTDEIFVIFQRLHSEDEYPGTGIGLALCKKIVERHNGRIWAESSPGEGSRFHFTLPA